MFVNGFVKDHIKISSHFPFVSWERLFLGSGQNFGFSSVILKPGEASSQLIPPTWKLSTTSKQHQQQQPQQQSFNDGKINRLQIHQTWSKICQRTHSDVSKVPKQNKSPIVITPFKFPPYFPFHANKLSWGEDGCVWNGY